MTAKHTAGVALRYKIYSRDNYTCQYCFHKLPLTPNRAKTKEKERKTLEHIIPQSFGGKATEENLILACARCNTLRGNMTIYPDGSHPDIQKYLMEIRTYIQSRL